MRKRAILQWTLAILLFPVLAITETVTPALELSLADCVERVLSENPQLVIARSGINVAEGQAKNAQAGMYPKINWNATVVRTNNLPDFKMGDPTMYPVSSPVANPEGDPAPVEPHTHLTGFPGFEFSNDREGNIYGVKFEATQPFYTGGALTNGIEAAKLQIRVAEHELKDQQLTLTNQTEQLFYGAFLAEEMIKVIEEAIATAKARYKWIQDLYQEGLVSNLDMLQIESMLASLEPQLIEARNNHSIALLGLKSMMNMDPSTGIKLLGSLEYQPQEIPDTREVVSEAMMNRPDVRSLYIRKSQAEKMIKVARSGYLPTLAGFANYQWNMGQEMPPNDEVWRSGWQAGIMVDVPIFDGGAAAGNMQAAESQYAQAEEGMRGLELMVQTDVQSAVLNLNKTEQQITAQKVSIEAAEKNFQVAQDRYRVGLANNLEVMDAEMELTQARAQYLSAVYEHIIARANLRKVRGQSYTEE